MAQAEGRTWTVAPSLVAGAAILAGVVYLRDGGLGALRRLPVEHPATPSGAPLAALGNATPGAGEPPPPLPPRRDLAAAGAAGGAPPSIPGRTVEDPCVEPTATGCGRWALDRFYQALEATERARATAPVRIAWFGDSVSATDAIPGRVRARLQDLFGDGGPGFVHAASPHRFNHNLAVARTSTGTWKSWAVSLANVGDHLYGYGAATAEGAGTITLTPLTPAAAASAVEVYYLAQPGGGQAELAIDGTLHTTIDTRAAAKEARFAGVTVPDGHHRVELRATGRVRLFGLVLERARGVVVDNLAVVSATAKSLLLNDGAAWQAQLAHRRPTLVVFMLGTNEAQWLSGSARSMADYEDVWRRLLAPVRAGVPDGACLVVSPLDQAEVKDGALVPRKGLPAMVATQRKVATAMGCAFWDTFTWMGGSGAGLRWNRKGLLGSDFAHLSHKGSALVADELADALVAGYKAYKAR